MSIPQQINFIGKLEEDDGAAMFFVSEKQQEAILNFFLDSLIVIANYDVGNEIIYNTEVSKSNICDYNNAYILIRGDFTITGHQATQLAFKNCAPFTKCITKIDGTTIDDVGDLDIVMPMCNLIEYSSNYSEKQEVYGFIQKMKRLILMQILLMIIILNLSCTVLKIKTLLVPVK